MIAEKPSWIKHEGMQIFSIDIQPGGLRFATGGGDHKVTVFSHSYGSLVLLLSCIVFLKVDGIRNCVAATPRIGI